ncbi:MAG: cytochrome c biogenesis protein CcdA [Methylobacteriaceae bacterium]|jgi:cytochrome c-type biogenesis protein|nr:cytochrome c biogenesis protein CcdA [Methylobacteriaceae bacterium]
MTHISYTLAAVGGMLSFVSPCVLPLVPPYLSYIAGVSLEEMNRGGSRQTLRRVMPAALLFVLGFSTIFVATGAAASGLGQTLLRYRDILNTIAGVAVILMGLHFLGVFRFALLYRQARFDVEKPLGLWGAYIMGLAFAFGWTPCIGPILAAILVLAGNEASVLRGASLLAVYSAGLGIPFLLAALLIGPFTALFRKFSRFLGWVEKLMGVLLIVTGVFILMNWNTWFAAWMLDAFPGVFDLEKTVMQWF